MAKQENAVIYIRREQADALEEGVNRCLAWCARNGVQIVGVLSEIGSGKSARPALEDALLSLYGAGTVLVTGTISELWAEGEDDWRLKVSQAQAEAQFTIVETDSAEAIADEMLAAVRQRSECELALA